MRWKAALLLFVIFFASMITTVAVSLGAPKLVRLIPEETTLDTGYNPTGDPVDGSGPPHTFT